MKEERFMQVCIAEAKKALRHGDIPVGAVIVKGNKVIAKAHNQKEKKKCSIFHAEIIAIQRASKKLKNWHLDGCEIYVTLEPCQMCLSAIEQSRISKVYYGASADNKNLNIVNVFQNIYNSRVEFSAGHMEGECKELLKTFFVRLRESKRGNEQSKCNGSCTNTNYWK